jgi:hypothetical protein
MNNKNMWKYTKDELPELNTFVNVGVFYEEYCVPSFTMKRCKYRYDEVLNQNVFIDKNKIYCVWAWSEEESELPGYIDDVYYEKTHSEYKDILLKNEKERLWNKEPVYLHNWKNKKDVIRDFHLENADLICSHILFASYSTDNWVGNAFVLFMEDGHLCEINGNHCSCFGLEGQWNKEYTSVKALLYRLNNGSFGNCGESGNIFKRELLKFLSDE